MASSPPSPSQLDAALSIFVDAGPIQWHKMRHDTLDTDPLPIRRSSGAVGPSPSIPSTTFNSQQQHSQQNNTFFAAAGRNSQPSLTTFDATSNSSSSSSSSSVNSLFLSSVTNDMQRAVSNSGFDPQQQHILPNNKQQQQKQPMASQFVAAVCCRLQPVAAATLLVTNLLDTHFVATLSAQDVISAFSKSAIGVMYTEEEALQQVEKCMKHDGDNNAVYFGVHKEDPDETQSDNTDDDEDDDDHYDDDDTDVLERKKQEKGNGKVVRARLLLENRSSFEEGVDSQKAQVAFDFISLPQHSRDAVRFLRDAVLLPVLRDTYAVRCVASSLVREGMQRRNAGQEGDVRDAARKMATGLPQQPAVGTATAAEHALRDIARSAEEIAKRRAQPGSSSSATGWLTRVTSMQADPKTAGVSVRPEEAALNAVTNQVSERTLQHQRNGLKSTAASAAVAAAAVPTMMQQQQLLQRTVRRQRDG